jgi:hypothetical protein
MQWIFLSWPRSKNPKMSKHVQNLCETVSFKAHRHKHFQPLFSEKKNVRRSIRIQIFAKLVQYGCVKLEKNPSCTFGLFSMYGTQVRVHSAQPVQTKQKIPHLPSAICYSTFHT